MSFKKCNRPCKYRSGTPQLNGCDYLYLTGKLRDCPAGKECTKFEQGDRMFNRTELLLPAPERLNESEYAVRDYVEEQKKRILRQKKAKHKH